MRRICCYLPLLSMLVIIPFARGQAAVDIGLGFESGMSVVMLAIILDRITESFGRAPGKARAPLFAGLRQAMQVRREPAAQHG